MIVPVSYDGTTCAPGWSALNAGGYDFELQDRGSDATAMTLLNAADGTAASPTMPVAPGARASIQARLRPGGAYEWRCQTGSQAAATSVSIQIPRAGTAAAAYTPAAISIVQLYQPLDRYTSYVSATLAKLRGQLAALDSRLSAGDVTRAKSAWLAADPSWLALGQDDGAYGAFGNLGNQIDGAADGDGQDLPATTVALDSWVLRCHEILEDALRDTLTGDDDYGSHTGLDAIGADVTATREMLSVLSGLIESRDPGLVQTATRQLAAIEAATSPPRAVVMAALPELA